VKYEISDQETIFILTVCKVVKQMIDSSTGGKCKEICPYDVKCAYDQAKGKLKSTKPIIGLDKDEDPFAI
jgi:hypothetical protein